jgi:hypothetical protein
MSGVNRTSGGDAQGRTIVLHKLDLRVALETQHLHTQERRADCVQICNARRDRHMDLVGRMGCCNGVW